MKEENQFNLDVETIQQSRKAAAEFVGSVRDQDQIYLNSTFSAMLDDDGGDDDGDDDADDTSSSNPWYIPTGNATGSAGAQPISNSIQQRIGNNGSGITTTTASNSLVWPFSTAGQNLLTSTQKKIKTSVRYIIFKADGSSLVLKEQNQITPQEMIGISKFLSIVTTVLHAGITKYNIEIKWSELIESLGISNHFQPGLSRVAYTSTESEILDIMLTDS